MFDLVGFFLESFAESFGHQDLIDYVLFWLWSQRQVLSFSHLEVLEVRPHFILMVGVLLLILNLEAGVLCEVHLDGFFIIGLIFIADREKLIFFEAIALSHLRRLRFFRGWESWYVLELIISHDLHRGYWGLIGSLSYLLLSHQVVELVIHLLVLDLVSSVLHLKLVGVDLLLRLFEVFKDLGKVLGGACPLSCIDQVCIEKEVKSIIDVVALWNGE